MRSRSRFGGQALLLAVVLSGCSTVGDPAPTVEQPDSPSRSAAKPQAGACLGDVDYPELPVWDLNQELPITGDVTPEYIQSEIAVRRGTGPCPVTHLPVDRSCEPWEGTSEMTVDAMLGSTPDEVTMVEFSRGATMAITETVNGSLADGGSFQYRMSAWRFADSADPQNSQILDLVAGCREAEVGPDRVTVTTGAEPHRIAYREDRTVYLIESIRHVRPDGTVSRIDETASGLLPSSAMEYIERWWTAHAGAYFDEAARGAGTDA